MTEGNLCVCLCVVEVKMTQLIWMFGVCGNRKGRNSASPWGKKTMPAPGMWPCVHGSESLCECFRVRVFICVCVCVPKQVGVCISHTENIYLMFLGPCVCVHVKAKVDHFLHSVCFSPSAKTLHSDWNINIMIHPL